METFVFKDEGWDVWNKKIVLKGDNLTFYKNYLIRAKETTLEIYNVRTSELFYMKFSKFISFVFGRYVYHNVNNSLLRIDFQNSSIKPIFECEIDHYDWNNGVSVVVLNDCKNVFISNEEGDYFLSDFPCSTWMHASNNIVVSKQNENIYAFDYIKNEYLYVYKLQFNICNFSVYENFLILNRGKGNVSLFDLLEKVASEHNLGFVYNAIYNGIAYRFEKEGDVKEFYFPEFAVSPPK